MQASKVLIAALIVAASAAPASAANLERESFRLSAIVPTVCNVSFGGTVNAAGNDVIDLGNVSELCNDRHGFRITMSHGAELQGAQLIVDGRAIDLSNSGQTVIVDENQPMQRVQSLQLRVDGAVTQMPNLFFRIEPKGPRF